jgi:hypothetical protein
MLNNKDKLYPVCVSQRAIKIDRLYTTIDGVELTCPSVTELLCGYSGSYITDQMITGTMVHSHLSNFLMTGDPLEIEDSLEKEKTDKLIKTLKNAMIQLKLFPCCDNTDSIEASRFGELVRDNESFQYKGTADLILDSTTGLVVVEFKTGKRAAWHKSQVVANMLLHDAILGVLAYEDDFEVVNSTSLEFSYLSNDFFNKLNAEKRGILKNGKIMGNVDDELAQLLKDIAVYTTEKKAIEGHIDSLKHQFHQLAPEKKSYETDDILVSYKKPNITYALKSDSKKELLITNPDFFDKKEVEESFVFKVKTK